MKRLRNTSFTDSNAYRIDEKGIIKVGDFGLAEDIYMRNYFRQSSQDSAVKLPLKWMAPESIKLGIFSEKSDVVSTHILQSSYSLAITRSVLNFLHAVVIWCDLLGGVHSRGNPLPRSPRTEGSAAARREEATQ